MFYCQKKLKKSKKTPPKPLTLSAKTKTSMERTYTDEMTYAEMFARLQNLHDCSRDERKRSRPADGPRRPHGEVSQDGTTSPERRPQRMKVCEDPIKHGSSTVQAKEWTCGPGSSSVVSKKFMLRGEPKRSDGEASQDGPSIPERTSQGRGRSRSRSTMNAEEKGLGNGTSSQRTPVTPPSTSAGDPSPVTQVQSQRTEEEASSYRSERKKVRTIWLIGSSYIQRGEEAAREIFGENFGLDAKVEWFGKGGLRWRGVLPLFYSKLSTRRPPDILVVHAGGNDLGLLHYKMLAAEMSLDLMQLHRDFPSIMILFSGINERQEWSSAEHWEINTDRFMVTYLISKAVDNFSSLVIQHPNLRYFDKTLYLDDGVHFSKKGNTIFLSKIRFHLQRILQIN